MRMERLLGGACGAVLLSLAVHAADWPEWRGPRRDAVSTETGLLKEWPKDGPRLLWQAKDIGDGYGTPSVAGNRVYVLGNRGMDNEFVQALSVKDGKQVWVTRLGKVGNPDQMPSFPTSRSTPTVNGGLVYALGSDGDLACLEAASGAVRWRKSLRADFGGVAGKFAYTESPLVDGDAVVVTPGGERATMVALNKRTGETIWKSAVPGGDDAAYASAIVVETGGHRQYVQFLAKGLVGVDAKTGEFLWRYDGTGKGELNMATPVASGGYVYTWQSRGPCGLVRLTAVGQGVKAEQAYLVRGLPSAIGGSVVVGSTHFGTTAEGLVAADWVTGKVLWTEAATAGGGVIQAENRLYIHGENGEAILAEATPAAYREKGRFMPPDRPKRTREAAEKAWASPVVAGGRLYIRELGSLWCYAIENGV